jgi:membrane protein required for colicin V production
MNAVDFIIVGALGVTGLMGLKSGLLRPASGIGGLVLGVVLAGRHSSQAARLLADHVDSEPLRLVAGFAAIVVLTAIAARLASVALRKLLAALALGWLDRVAGVVAGIALGVVLSGTVVYIVAGADFDATRDKIAESQLAPSVSRASFISAATPWCSSMDAASVEDGKPCTDRGGLFDQLIGRHIGDSIPKVDANDVAGVADVVKGALGGSRQTEGSTGDSPP